MTASGNSAKWGHTPISVSFIQWNVEGDALVQKTLFPSLKQLWSGGSWPCTLVLSLSWSLLVWIIGPSWQALRTWWKHKLLLINVSQILCFPLIPTPHSQQTWTLHFGYVAQFGLDLTYVAQAALKHESLVLLFPHARISGMHHTQQTGALAISELAAHLLPFLFFSNCIL